MKIKQILSIAIASFALVVGVAMVAPQAVSADCGGVQTSIIDCPQDNKGDDIKDNGVWGLLMIAVNIMTAGVGVLALGGIIYGAVLYTSAGGNPEQVKKAKTIFTNVSVGVVAFAGMWALLNFIIPGGVF